MDAAVAEAVRAIASPGLTRAMLAVTLLGDAWVMVVHTVVACALLWAWGRRREAGALAAAMVVGPAVSTALKALIARPRPPVAGALITMPGSGSLPSGHALAGLLFYGSLALMLLADVSKGEGDRIQAHPVARAGAACLFAIGLTVGLSRVYLGVHWTSDVVAGWAIAAALLAGVWRVVRGR